VDEPGVILTSRDGMTWTRRRSPTKANLYGIAFGNGTYVSVGDNGTVLTSPDGVIWKRRAGGASELLLSSLAFGNGTFVALGDSGTVLTSTDAVHWLTSKVGQVGVRVGVSQWYCAFSFGSARQVKQ